VLAQTSDLDPAQRTLRVRTETTKNRRERVVPYSAAAGNLLAAHPAHLAHRYQPGAGRCTYRSRAATMPIL